MIKITMEEPAAIAEFNNRMEGIKGKQFLCIVNMAGITFQQDNIEGFNLLMANDIYPLAVEINGALHWAYIQDENEICNGQTRQMYLKEWIDKTPVITNIIEAK